LKRCPSCNSTYSDNSLAFCLIDGTPLVSETPDSYDPAKTLASPPPAQTSNPLTPPQVASAGQVDFQQPYRQQQPLLPVNRGGNKKSILVMVGLLLMVAIGLGIYFLVRSSAASTASKRFVGTWVEENKPGDKGARFTEDGKIMAPHPPVNTMSAAPSGNDEEQVGTYTVNGDKATINSSKGTITGTLESDNRLRLESQGKTIYLTRK
jgi:hypothetical protein